MLTEFPHTIHVVVLLSMIISRLPAIRVMAVDIAKSIAPQSF